MKKIKFSIFSIACLLLCISCENETDFLTAENINSPNANDFVIDRGTAEASLFAIYSGLQFNGVCGGGAANTFEAMSVTSKAPHYDLNGGTGALNSLTFSIDSGFTLNSFSDLYQLIDRANISISSIELLTEDVISNAEKLLFLSEARFLRALGYFWLTTTYNNGSVPLITRPSTTLEESQQASSNIKGPAEIYAQIEQDLVFAQKYLPFIKKDRTVIENGEELTIRMWSPEFKGRATWGAATAYLGKVYLYQEKNSQAIAEFEKIVQGEGVDEYALVSDFKMNSSIDGEWNEESIFEVGFSQEPQVVTGNFGGGEGSTLNETTTRGFLFAWNPGGGWGITHSSNFITELFKSDIVDETNPINFEDGDITNMAPENFTGFSKRCNATIAFTGDGKRFYDQNLVATADGDELGFTTSQSRIRKFTNWELLREPRQAVSEINERLMRLADVYLMYAEALLKERGDAGVTTAVDYIDRVRNRAGVIDLATLFGSARTYLAGPQNSDAIASGGETFPVRALNAENVLKHLLNEERILEFAFEGRGITWQDTRRRADVGDWINFVNNIGYKTNDITGEFSEAASKLRANPNAGYFPLPAIEVLGRSSN